MQKKQQISRKNSPLVHSDARRRCIKMILISSLNLPGVCFLEKMVCVYFLSICSLLAIERACIEQTDEWLVRGCCSTNETAQKQYALWYCKKAVVDKKNANLHPHSCMSAFLLFFVWVRHPRSHHVAKWQVMLPATVCRIIFYLGQHIKSTDFYFSVSVVFAFRIASFSSILCTFHHRRTSGTNFPNTRKKWIHI